MNVCILTKAKLFEKEEFVDVFASVKAAEKHIRKISQYAKKDSEGSYSIKDNKTGEITLYFTNTKNVIE